MRVSTASPYKNIVLSLIPTTTLRSRNETSCRRLWQQTFLSPYGSTKGLV